MWTEYLQLAGDESLHLTQEIQLYNQGQESIKEWQIRNREGRITGSVILRDKLNSRRSYSGDYRLTQRDGNGAIVLDRLINHI